ncbi:MAG: cupin domain-containing protein [Magnetococcales bacterium]|nr:cupin domain-containing protein [Magnetococcales bacterium]
MPQPLIILEMANNHMGSLDHGLRLVEAFGQASRPFPFRFAFKLQYRHLDTFIHPDYQGRSDIKYIKRFSETRLQRSEFKQLVAKIKEQGFLAICTPFDEASVDFIEEDGIDVLKIASCSFTDWPLWERVVKSNLPLIASTATATVKEMDNVVSFLKHRDKSFALLHCVAEYPTEQDKIQLNQIDFLKNRYPQVPIGYSTHESPSCSQSIPMVIAKGATIIERHVGLPTDQYPLNAYSGSPEDFVQWMQAATNAFTLCGAPIDTRIAPTPGEVASLASLRRGVFVKKDIPAGYPLGDKDVFFAIPCQDGQVTANDWSKYSKYSPTSPLKAGQPLLFAEVNHVNSRQLIGEIVQDVKQLLQKGHVIVPGAAELEISHHYGQEKFYQYGATMITVINRQYCKKLLVVLPGQRHPEHYHAQKDESFYVLHGTLNIVLDGVAKVVRAGEIVPVASGVRHSFSSDTGVVFEEVSTTHVPNDSFYTDPTIMENPHRKTFLTHWMDKPRVSANQCVVLE